MHSRGHVCMEYVTYLVGRDVPETDTRTDNVTNTRDFQNVRRYETQFNRVFMAGSAGSQTVINNREFAAFYHLLRCFDEDILTVANNKYFFISQGHFTVHFVQSPFLSGNESDSRGFQYQQSVLIYIFMSLTLTLLQGYTVGFPNFF